MSSLPEDAAESDRVVVRRLDDAPPDVPLRALAAAVERAMTGLALPAHARCAVVLAGDERLRALNLRYRGIDAPTDVLSFRTDDAGAPGPGDEGADLGDVIISVDYAARSAAGEGRPRDDELALLAVHGLLHLIGHDDADEAGAAAMRAEERRLGVRRD